MSYGLRYFFSFYADRDTRIDGGLPDEYDVNILDLDYVGESEQIEAPEFPVTINYPGIQSLKTAPIAASNCTLNMIATAAFQLQELYTESERRWLVQVLRNGSKIWQGFIIPDGCQQSFTFPPYTISNNCVDTLGILRNLSYVQNDGNFWLGKQNFIDVIYNCLNRIQIPDTKLYTCVNLYEESYPDTISDDPLALTYINAETFLKDDNINPLNCQEVLENILHVWGAVIIQSEGDWYVFRPNELALSDTLIFRKYEDGQPAYSGFTVSKNLGQLLGGYSEGVILAPLFHIDEDQTTVIQKPYRNASMSWKFGNNYNLVEELANPTLSGAVRGCPGDPADPCDDVTIPGYTKTGFMELGSPITGGITFFNQGDTSPILTDYYQNNNTIAVVRNSTQADRLRFTIVYENPDPLFNTDMNFVISLSDGLSTWYLQADFSWMIPTPGLSYYQVRSDIGDGGTLIVETSPVPSGGNVTFRILAPTGTIRDIVYTSISAGVFIDPGEQIGEIHTATQTQDFTFVPDTISVLNGDGATAQYMGAMYETDETTLTSNWYRKYAGESILAEPFATYKPILRLAVEELQRIYANPFISYEGTIFGYFNPLSVFRINLLTGKFMPVSLSYNLQANTCKAVLTRIANEEIAMDYTLEPDYGATTKVLVR
jgi:hypothetical protein